MKPMITDVAASKTRLARWQKIEIALLIARCADRVAIHGIALHSAAHELRRKLRASVVHTALRDAGGKKSERAKPRCASEALKAGLRG
jgi:hypothetical protein